MAIRLLLLNKRIQTTQLFKDAVLAIGAELSLLESPEQAGRRIRDERFDAIFVDTALPGLDRHYFIRRVRKSKFSSQARIFLMTAYSGPGRAAVEAPTDSSFMVKPSTGADLDPLLRELKRKLMAERRKHRRLSFRTTVNCVKGPRRFRGVSVNLSSMGMLLEASSPLGRGDELEIYFHLAVEEPVFRARVRVVRIDELDRVGLVFQNLASAVGDRLLRFLDLHLLPLR